MGAILARTEFLFFSWKFTCFATNADFFLTDFAFSRSFLGQVAASSCLAGGGGVVLELLGFLGKRCCKSVAAVTVIISGGGGGGGGGDKCRSK